MTIKQASWPYLITRSDRLFSVIDAGVFTLEVKKELSAITKEIKRRLKG